MQKRSTMLIRMLLLLCAAVLPACRDPAFATRESAAESLDVVRMRNAFQQYKMQRFVEEARLREWVGIGDWELLDTAIDDAGLVTTADGSAASYRVDPWNLGIAQISQGAVLGKVSTIFETPAGPFAGFYDVGVRETAEGFVGDFVDLATQETVYTGPARVSVVPWLWWPPTLKAWGVLTLRVRNWMWTFDYHWRFQGWIFHIEIAIPQQQLIATSSLAVPEDDPYVAAGRDFRDVGGGILTEVADGAGMVVRPDFVTMDRLGAHAVHASLETPPSLDELAGGAYAGISFERGARVDPAWALRAADVDPALGDSVAGTEAPEGFYRLFVAGEAAVWEDLDGNPIADRPATVEVGDPTGAPPWTGASIGVLEDRFAAGWDTDGAQVSIEVALPL